MPTNTLVLTLQAASALNPGPATVEMLQPGLWSQAEVGAPPGDQGPGWFALLSSPEGGFRLEPTAVRVVALPVPLLPTEAALEVSTDAGRDTVVLLRGVPGMKAGPLLSRVQGPAVVRLGAPVLLPGSLGERSALRLRAGEGRPSMLLFDVAGAGTASGRQELTETEDDPYLHWAGDLDGDGRTDLLLSSEQARPDPVTVLQLFLSGRARQAELVGLAASLSFRGC